MTDTTVATAPNRWVDIRFDCLPLRSLPRKDAPIDASPRFAEKVLRIRKAIDQHGTHNTYYLHNAACEFHFTNDAAVGAIRFEFEGTIFTDGEDRLAARSDLNITIVSETCDWLHQGIVQWLKETVHHAVRVEFGRYIAAGDLAKTRARLQAIEQQVDQGQGYVGMYL